MRRGTEMLVWLILSILGGLVNYSEHSTSSLRKTHKTNADEFYKVKIHKYFLLPLSEYLVRLQYFYTLLHPTCVLTFV